MYIVYVLYVYTVYIYFIHTYCRYLQYTCFILLWYYYNIIPMHKTLKSVGPKRASQVYTRGTTPRNSSLHWIFFVLTHCNILYEHRFLILQLILVPIIIIIIIRYLLVILVIGFTKRFDKHVSGTEPGCSSYFIRSIQYDCEIPVYKTHIKYYVFVQVIYTHILTTSTRFVKIT